MLGQFAWRARAAAREKSHGMANNQSANSFSPFRGRTLPDVAESSRAARSGLPLSTTQASAGS